VRVRGEREAGRGVRTGSVGLEGVKMGDVRLAMREGGTRGRF